MPASARGVSLVNEGDLRHAENFADQREPLTVDAYRPFGQVIELANVRMKIVNDRFRMGIIPKLRGR
jgi:hypothetical protein